MRKAPPQRHASKVSFQIEELEPRLLFSADAATLLGLPVAAPAGNPSSTGHTASAEGAAMGSVLAMQAVVTAPAAAVPSQTVRHELVFVDATVPDADKLVQGIQAGASAGKVIDVIVIQSDEDGLARITTELQQRHDVDAVHIISHGDPSGLALGNGRLDAASLNANLGDISSWAQALSGDADLLLYGCDLAQAEAGRQLVDNLSLLTGADVAASSDLSGAAALGGNWTLEYLRGDIEAQVVVDTALAGSWDHVLATLTLQNGVNGYTGTTDTYLNLANGVANNSGDTTLHAGPGLAFNPQQTLIKFENLIGTGANQIPSGAIITGVTLTLTESSTSYSYDLYRMQAAWTDTSNYLSMGNGVDGSEYKSTADHSTKTGVFSSAAMIATVQAWVNDPASNQGWMLNSGTAYSGTNNFSSSESGTVANRPKLSITYTTPTPPSVDLDANNSSGATGSGYSVAFTEQTPVKIADADAAITAGTNSISTKLSGMTVKIVNPLDGAAESLSATTTGTSITASYNSGTGVLTLSGSDTVANYQTVLRSVTYNNTSDNPTTTSRTINVVATDPYGGSGATASTTLSVSRVNDAPTITSNGGGSAASVNVRENTVAVTTVTASDPDNASLTYSISGGADAAKFTINASTGVLTFISAPNFDSPGDVGANNVYDVIVRVFDGALTDTQALAVTVSNVNEAPVGTSKTVTTNEDTVYTFTVADFGFTDPSDLPANTLLNVKITTLPAVGSLRLNGAAVTAGQIISANDISLGLLKFTPVTNANGAGYASFTFQVQDNGGTANGGVNLDATPRTMTVNVSVVNDAPVGASTTITTLEDTAYTFTTADFGFTDPKDSPANTLLGVKITTLPASGSLTLSGVAVTAGQVISAANITSGFLKYTPAANANGAGHASFTFQVQDNGGTANGGVNLDVTPRTITVNVTAMNDAPVGTNKTVVTNEDTVYTFIASDFGFTDPNDSPANTLLGVKITTLPAAGNLTLNGVAVTAGQVISAANITSGLLKFTPAANASGAGHASFTFQVQDNGGTANGGVDLDATPRTMTVNVTAVNDAPVGTSKTVTTNEDTAYTFTVADFGFTDPNDSVANALQGVKITTLPALGSLRLNGVAVTAGQIISVANINAGSLKFTPVANANGAAYASFTFQVQDNGGTANGGANLDATPRTLTVNVTAVNDEPSGANRTVITLENAAYVFSVIDFGFTDASDSSANALLAVKITTVPGAGTLTLNGLAVNAGDFVLASDIVAGLLVFTPAAGVSGLPYASFTFQAQDNGGTANGGVDLDATPATMTVNVSNTVNSAPEGLDNTVVTLEDVAYVFTSADFGFSDADDLPSNQLLAVKMTTVPTSGSLTLNGVAVSAGDFVLASDIDVGGLVYTPGGDGNGPGYASFTFQVQDDGGTANGGANLDATPRTMTVNVSSVNDAPTGASTTITTLEDTAYTFTAADFGFADPNDAPDNALLAVRITTVPAAGSLMLNGVAVTAGQVISAADLASGLLVYTPGANDEGAGYTSFTFQVQDDGGTAHGGVDLDATPRTLTVDVTAVNDAPVGTDKAVTTNEDTAYTFTAADFGFTDPNDAPGDTLLAVRITTVPAAGSLMLNGVVVTAGQVVSMANITSGLLKYTPAANANGVGYASFTFQVQDNGGTAHGGVDLDATPRTMTVNVTAVNDAPAGTDKTVTTNEDTAYTFTVADFGFTDPNDSPAGALQAVRITTVPASGSLTLNGVAVTAGQVILATDIASGLLRFTPVANANGAGYASFTFQVQDNGGTANGGANLDATPRTMTVNVNSVNDAPTGASTTITTLEDTAYTFTAADFGFADMQDAPGNALLAVRITTVPAAGSLTLNGVAVTAGQVISAADLASGLLVYTSGANDEGAGYTSFTFQVQDDGGTAHGGVDLDATPRTLTVDVTAVNDAPVGTDKAVTTNEDTAYTFTAADFGFTDPNDAPGDTLLSVRITTVPAAGSLMLNGVAVTAGQVVSMANITSGLLKYTPAANANGAGYASFTFQVQDNGGTAHGGVDLDATPRTMTVNVTAVNDSPVGTDKTVTTNEDTAYTFTVADFGFTDPNDSPGGALQAVRITTVPASGSLTLNGVAVNAGDLISASDLAAGKMAYTPVAARGPIYASFTFQVMDDGGSGGAGSDTDAIARRMSIAVALAVGPGGAGAVNPGTGAGGNSGFELDTNPVPSSNPPVDSKDDAAEEIEDKLGELTGGASTLTEGDPLPLVHRNKDDPDKPAKASIYSSSYGITKQMMGFAFRLELGAFNLGLNTGNMQFEMSANANVPIDQDLNLSFSSIDVNGSGHAAPTLLFTETAEDRKGKVEKTVMEASGAALSIGAVWWAARISGLLASLMISTPAWRSIDPLPVMGLGGGKKGPDDDHAGDDHPEDPSGLDARAAGLFAANKGTGRELEGIG